MLDLNITGEGGGGTGLKKKRKTKQNKTNKEKHATSGSKISRIFVKHFLKQ